MIFHFLSSCWSRMMRVFNLNDEHWGREPSSSKPQGQGNPRPQQAPRSKDGTPPDLDELWRDFQDRLGGILGKRRKGGGPLMPTGKGPQRSPIRPSFILSSLLLAWLGSGFFVVQEGQQAVITQFGRYHSTVGAGFNWRLPYPIQSDEKVFVTQIRSVDIGSNAIVEATGLKDSSMLTADENIVDIKFAVQYRLSDARAYLYASQNPDDAVIKAAETAVREVLGKMKMDLALSEERDQIAPNVRALMQNILDRYQIGIEIVAINLQQGGVRPPEQVQAAFDDVLKAAQERERSKNEAQAYANDVVPKARGQASRLLEEAQAYKARMIAQAQGDAQRFDRLYAEYRKAPQVTRDRLYIDAMKEMYSNVTKVVVESKQGSNLLYLPLDKLLQSTRSETAVASGSNAPSEAASPASAQAATAASSSNAANARVTDRDAAQSRVREGR